MFPASGLLKFLLCTFLLLKNIALAEDTHHFIYHGFNETSLQLNGSAKIMPESGLLQLTNLSYEQIGHAFFRTPFKFNKSFSFSTTFAFAIVPERPAAGGQGFMFVISPSVKFEQAQAVEYFGIFSEETDGNSSNHIFGVEFDTIKSLGLKEKDNNHVAIDVNSVLSNVSEPAGYYSGNEKISLQLISGNLIRAWIDYDDEGKVINVTIAPSTIEKPKRPLISTSIDLSLILVDSMYVGFSSCTGTVSSSCHYILGWSFNTSGPAENLDISKLPPIPTPAREPEISPIPPPEREAEIPPIPPPARKPDTISVLSILYISLSATVVLVSVSAAFYMYRRKKFDEIREDWEKEYGPQRFSYKELYKATKGFKEKELLGIGGFGRVYKGLLPSSNQQVAVKKFSHESQQGMKEFIAEIASMGRLRHRNLVQLLGYCRRKGELLLVYEFMPNASLDKYLFKNELKLNWVHRFRILKGVASALLYLHEEWEQVVIHRDVKSSNVMLDGELNGRLGDFGLAKFYNRGTIPQTTSVVGTVGYLAPEVSRTGRVTTSSDVFSFGVLMLEVACGRRAIEPERTPQEAILVEWVFDSWREGVILEISDPRLEGKYMEEEMELVLKLGLLCTQSRPADRPVMRQVVQYLDRQAGLPEIPRDSSPRTGLVRVNQDSYEEYNLSFPTITEYSALSITDSVLDSGR